MHSNEWHNKIKKQMKNEYLMSHLKLWKNDGKILKVNFCRHFSIHFNKKKVPGSNPPHSV